MRGAIIWRRLTMIRLDSGYLLVDVRDIRSLVDGHKPPDRVIPAML